MGFAPVIMLRFPFIVQCTHGANCGYIALYRSAKSLSAVQLPKPRGDALDLWRNAVIAFFPQPIQLSALLGQRVRFCLQRVGIHG